MARACYYRFCTIISHMTMLGSGSYQVAHEIQVLGMGLLKGYMQSQRAGDMSARRGDKKIATMLLHKVR